MWAAGSQARGELLPHCDETVLGLWKTLSSESAEFTASLTTSPYRIFLRELESCIDCPELVGRCFLERVSVSNCMRHRQCISQGSSEGP